jgi:hypothetical protein
MLLPGVTLMDWQAWRIEIILGILAAISIYRMHLFGVHYGRKLFVQFLALK